MLRVAFGQLKLTATRSPWKVGRALGGLVREGARILVGEIGQHRDERRVVLEILPHDLVVRVPIGVPGRPPVIPA